MTGPSSRLRSERKARSLLDEQARDIRKIAEEDVMLSDERRLVLRSPDGHFWSLGVDNSGALTTTDLGTTL